MKIDICNTYDELSGKAKEIIIQEIKRNKNLFLCAATGGSPTGTYDLLAKEYLKKPELFAKLRVIKLDEWGGIPMDLKGTCESYLQDHLILPLHIPEVRYISFNSNPTDPLNECKRIQEKLDEQNSIDLCILGLGMNGHLALNEPADFLQPNCHVAELSVTTLLHPMTFEMNLKPAFGMTLGIADILNSKLILILINGAQKKTIVRRFLSHKITSTVPGSFLWLHSNVICLIVKDAIEESDDSKNISNSKS